MVSGVIYIFANVEGGSPVLDEVRDKSGPKRCAIIDIVPTGSYQTTLSLIGLSAVGFEGFPSGAFCSATFFARPFLT